MECDFCSSPNVTRRFQCMDFIAESRKAGLLYPHPEGPTNVVFESRSYWAACDECARFVDAEDMEGLLIHAVAELCKDRPMNEIAKRHFIRHLNYVYEIFFETRIRIAE